MSFNYALDTSARTSLSSPLRNVTNLSGSLVGQLQARKVRVVGDKPKVILPAHLFNREIIPTATVQIPDEPEVIDDIESCTPVLIQSPLIKDSIESCPTDFEDNDFSEPETLSNHASSEDDSSLNVRKRSLSSYAPSLKSVSHSQREKTASISEEEENQIITQVPSTPTRKSSIAEDNDSYSPGVLSTPKRRSSIAEDSDSSGQNSLVVSPSVAFVSPPRKIDLDTLILMAKLRDRNI